MGDNSQLSQYSVQYFTNLQEQVHQNHLELEHFDEFIQERKRKFEASLKSYQKYVSKEQELLKRNINHSELRNKFYLQEVKKAWKNAISNRQIVLRSLARTNVVKQDADEWIRAMEDECSRSYNHDGQDNQSELEGSKLIHKYNEILSQYNIK